MASKNGNTAKQEQEAVQFINYTLTDKEKAAFKKSLETLDAAKFFETLDGLVANGYTVSVKWDSFNKCISAFLTAKNTSTENDGCILTGRGRTAVSALYGAIYRHTAIFGGVWPLETINHRGTDDD